MNPLGRRIFAKTELQKPVAFEQILSLMMCLFQNVSVYHMKGRIFLISAPSSPIVIISFLLVYI